MAIHLTKTGQGHNIVLLHGWSCDSRHMQPLVDHLAQHYTVYNFDLPGMGQSDWQDSITTVDDMTDLLLPLLPEKAIYIGWSFGGLAATSIANRFPEKVERLIGITTTPKFIEDDNWPSVPKPGFSAAFEEMKNVGYGDFFKGMYDVEFASLAEKPESYYKLINMLKEVENTINLDILLKGVNICDETDYRPHFQNLTCPIDLILGYDDGSVPHQSYEAIKNLNANAQLHIIEQAQHLPFWTHPKQFFSILDNILR